jgi:hypothetical protein
LKFIYVAGPYTKGDVAVNVRRNIEVGSILADAGYVPFIPLLTHFWHLVSPHPYEFWLQQDAAWVERCCAMVRTPGESSGADKEIVLAESLKRPVYHYEGEFSIADFNKWAEWHRYCRATGLDPDGGSIYTQVTTMAESCGPQRQQGD